MIRQLYSQLRERVLAGKLAPGEQLPASRELAEQLGISRNIVLQAYDLLHAEGFLEARQGAGTFVAPGAAYRKNVRAVLPPVEKVTMGYDSPEEVINFRAGTPELSMFPKSIWLKMIREVLSQPMEDILVYGHPEGRTELREAICEYVVTQREVDCHPDQIVVTAGTTQAIGLVCQLLLKERKDVVLEDPITRDIQTIAKGHGAVLHPVPVDDHGMQTEKLSPDISPAFLYVTPSHQFPTGGTLPIQRRVDMLKYAEEKNCYVIEDDYDSEFRFDGPPLGSLHGLNPDRVIYIGTFSKTLCPAIRIGYLVLPAGFIHHGRIRKWHSDLHNEVISQLTLAEFIRRGFYLKHVAKMRKQYLKKRKRLVHALHRFFGNSVVIRGSSTGLHLVAEFIDHNFTDELLARVEEGGARFYSVEIHSIVPGKHLRQLLIGYGNLTVEEIDRGIEILARVLADNDAA